MSQKLNRSATFLVLNEPLGCNIINVICEIILSYIYSHNPVFEEEEAYAGYFQSNSITTIGEVLMSPWVIQQEGQFRAISLTFYDINDTMGPLIHLQFRYDGFIWRDICLIPIDHRSEWSFNRLTKWNKRVNDQLSDVVGVIGSKSVPTVEFREDGSMVKNVPCQVPLIVHPAEPSLGRLGTSPLGPHSEGLVCFVV